MRPVPPPPTALPEKRQRLRPGGEPYTTVTVSLEAVTPIMGGAVQARDIDDTDVIRVPSVRGHLRFWWRALYGHQFATAKDLYRAESAIWGRAAEADGLGRSAVEVRLSVGSEGETTADNPSFKDPDFYATWPAQAPRDNPYDVGKRRKPGTTFDLTLLCPKGEVATQVRNALKAWILFGGYGGRTRRGLGSLRVTADQAAWLPKSPSREELQALFGFDVIAAVAAAVSDVPRLAGAALAAGNRTPNANAAWITALNWLKDFRQKPGEAREQGSGRPGRSKWPESDKVRRLSGRGPWAHEPRHNDDPAWPRAGFGLPIISQFQKFDANKQRYRLDEPRDYQIRWRPRGGKPADRLASPLIVKAMPLADGGFAPIALWLARSFPDGEVVIVRQEAILPGSAAPFDQLVGKGETPLFPPLAAGLDAPEGQRLQKAFFSWLAKTGVKEVL